MAEKRLAMGVASMQKELSGNARKLGGNAVANVKMDYEVIQGTATISIVATADAIKMRSPPKKNPAPSKKLKRAKDKYKKFHGGKEPVSSRLRRLTSRCLVCPRSLLVHWVHVSKGNRRRRTEVHSPHERRQQRRELPTIRQRLRMASR